MTSRELIEAWQKLVAHKEQDNYDVHNIIGNLEIIGKVCGHKFTGEIIVHPENTTYMIDGLCPIFVELDNDYE